MIFGEDNIGVIDTGYENTPVDFVFPLIQSKNRRLGDVKLIVNTPRDGDHVRGNDMFKEKTSAPVAIHSLEVEAVLSADLMRARQTANYPET